MTGADLVSVVPAAGGSAPATPVLLLHCTGSTGGQWAALAARLSPRFCVLTPDVAGWGRAGRTPSDQTLAAEAARLADAMAAFDTPFHLVGHSMGGAIAARLALTKRARVRSLTLIEPVLFHLLRDGDAADRALHLEPAALADRMRRGAAEGSLAGSAAAMRDFVDFWNGSGAWEKLDPAWRDAVAPQAARVAANFDALDGADFPLDAVRSIAAPTLMLMGSATQPSARRIVEKLFDALPLAALATIHGANHMLPFTHAGTVNDRIVAHIAAVESSGEIVLPAFRHAA